jgi:hypothetical protein
MNAQTLSAQFLVLSCGFLVLFCGIKIQNAPGAREQRNRAQHTYAAKLSHVFPLAYFATDFRSKSVSFGAQ